VPKKVAAEPFSLPQPMQIVARRVAGVLHAETLYFSAQAEEDGVDRSRLAGTAGPRGIF
jgi:hypothetical protein